MGTSILVFAIAVLGGIAVSIQAQFMGLMDKQLGTLESILITYGVGGLAIGLVMVLNRGGNLAAWPQVPWYALTAGLVGLVIVGAFGYSTARVGLVTTLTIIVAAQFVTGAVIDHFGLLGAELRPLTFGRVSGIALMLLGLWQAVR